MINKHPFIVKDLLLAVLHGVSMDSVSELILVKLGEVMGVGEEDIKSSLKQLINDDYLERVENNNNYRILPERSLFSQHFDQWRLSENRRIAWDRTWIICNLAAIADSEKSRKKSLWALKLLGFKTSPGGLLIRPNNLLGGIDALRVKLLIFGLEPTSELFVASSYEDDKQEFLETQLWPLQELTQSYKEAYEKVMLGYEMLKGEVTQDVLVYALKTGYESIRLLAIDPLLPVEMLDPYPRVKLTRLLIEYETLGKRYWEAIIPGLYFN